MTINFSLQTLEILEDLVIYKLTNQKQFKDEAEIENLIRIARKLDAEIRKFYKNIMEVKKQKWY